MLINKTDTYNFKNAGYNRGFKLNVLELKDIVLNEEIEMCGIKNNIISIKNKSNNTYLIAGLNYTVNNNIIKFLDSFTDIILAYRCEG